MRARSEFEIEPGGKSIVPQKYQLDKARGSAFSWTGTLVIIAPPLSAFSVVTRLSFAGALSLYLFFPFDTSTIVSLTTAGPHKEEMATSVPSAVVSRGFPSSGSSQVCISDRCFSAMCRSTLFTVSQSLGSTS